MMHEDLLGYLLGALEPDEMRRVSRWLQDDPEARAELAKIEDSLRPLQQSDLELGPFPESELPASDLVARTLGNLPPLPPPAPSMPPTVSWNNGVSWGHGSKLAGLRPTIEAPDGWRRSWLDWAGAAVSIAIFLALLLPMLAQGRLEARKIACQDHLRQFGTALTRFVNRSPQQRLPAVAESGPEAFAGIYAIRLNQIGLLDDPSIRWCPSRALPASALDADELHDTAQLYRLSVDQLQSIQQHAGGHYAYSLGVIDTTGYTSPRFESRSSFAVMSDAPLHTSPGSDADDTIVGHSGSGINILYEDGRVQFVRLESLDSLLDHPLRNHLGQREAGVNVDDASLAPSWRPPFVHVRQR